MLKINSQIQKKAFSLIEISIVILIIGILIGGIASSSRLVKKAKLNSAQNLTAKSPALDIEDLGNWIDTSSSGSITGENSGSGKIKNGEEVVSWNFINPFNKSVTTLTRYSDGQGPTYVENGIGGIPSLSFKTSALSGMFTDTRILPQAPSRFTLIIVARVNQASSDAVPGTWANVSILGQQNFVMACAKSGGAGPLLPLINNAVQNFWGTPQYLIDKDSIIVARSDPSLSTQFAMHINNSGGGFNLPLNPFNTANLNGQFFVGHSPSANNSADFLISELIVYNRYLDDSELSDIYSYLRKKYKISF